MDGHILCTCGELLVEEVNERGVRPVGADSFIVFRRTTDYVVCPACLAAYGVRSLIARAAGDLEVIGRLERMAEQAEHPAES